MYEVTMKISSTITVSSSDCTEKCTVKGDKRGSRFDMILDDAAHAMEKDGNGGRSDTIRILREIIERQLYRHCVRSMARDTDGWDRSLVLAGGLRCLSVLSMTEDEDGAKGKEGNVVPTDMTNRIIEDSSRKHGVDATLIRAVIKTESNFNSAATSAKGAMGLMQIMPETARELGVRNPYDPVENIMEGTRYLKMLLDRYDGDRNIALAAYNWGMGNVERHPHRLPEETKKYIVSVNRYIDEARERLPSV